MYIICILFIYYNYLEFKIITHITIHKSYNNWICGYEHFRYNILFRPHNVIIPKTNTIDYR